MISFLAGAYAIYFKFAPQEYQQKALQKEWTNEYSIHYWFKDINLITNNFVPDIPWIKQMYGVLGIIKVSSILTLFYYPWLKTKMCTKRKILMFFLVQQTLGFVFFPELGIDSGYRGFLVLLSTLMLVLYEDFHIVAVITCISAHCNDMGHFYTQDNLRDKDYSQVATYFTVYALHYYVAYMGLVRSFELKH